MKYLILFTTLIFAAELEVDGDLKVTGTVDANGNPITNVGAALSMTDAINGNVLQSALRDDGVYEIMFVYIRFLGSGNSSGNELRYIKYVVPTDVDTGDISWSVGGISKLNQLLLDGWKISARLDSGVGSDAFYVYELQRKISND